MSIASRRAKTVTKMVDDLQPILTDGETVLLATSGLAEVQRLGRGTGRPGVVFVTDRRVGIFSKKVGGHDLTDFAFGLLTSVEHKRGFKFGEVTVMAAGSRTRFHMIPKAEVDEMAATIRGRMALSTVPTAAPSSAADEIAKLVALRDAGAITDDEFEAHKAALLP